MANNKLRIFTAFSGYDSQCLGLNRTGIDYELVGWSEIEKNAINAHNALFPQYSNLNYGDICKIDWNKVPDMDMLFYSSPCKNFSLGGKHSGGDKGSGTESSLLWECEKAIEIKRPKYLILENVDQLVGTKFLPCFNDWCKVLEGFGYSTYWKVMNAKDYGIPQSRKRVFAVSVLNNEDGPFVFPSPIGLKTSLIDILDKNPLNPQYLNVDPYFNDPNYKDTNNVIGSLIEAEKLYFKGHPIVLGWSRDDKGNVKNRHPVDVANTITLAKRNTTQNFIMYGDHKFRKFTANECLKLMGLTEKEADTVLSVCCETAAAKLAGNSIVVDCLELIFRSLFKLDNPRSKPECDALF